MLTVVPHMTTDIESERILDAIFFERKPPIRRIRNTSKVTGE